MKLSSLELFYPKIISENFISFKHTKNIPLKIYIERENLRTQKLVFTEIC